MRRLAAEVAVPLAGAFSESPRWRDEDCVLIWADIREHVIFEASGGLGPVVRRPVESEIGAVVLAANGDLVVCRTGGVDLVPSTLGRSVEVAEIEAGVEGNRMNDAACDPGGRLWCGTRGVDPNARSGGLYRVEPNGGVTRMLAALGISNGIGWSPCGRWLYHVDSPTRRVDRYPFAVESGEIGRRDHFASFEPGLLGDGLCVDELGGVWVAVWGCGEVRRYDPDGRLDTTVSVPAVHATSCCFGGETSTRLFVTTAEDEGSSGQAGSVFVVETGVRGAPAGRFALCA
jgi:sugar lactone lactonase YvrE